jgi:hypothetical protein
MVKVNLSRPVISCKPIDLDNVPLRFGKYKGKTPTEIAKHDPSYIVWMWNKMIDPPVTRDLVLDCEHLVQEGRDEDYDCDGESWAREFADE